MSACLNPTRQARETLAALQRAGMVSQGCAPKFRQYGMATGLLITADGSTFGTAASEGTAGEYLKFTTDGEHKEVLLDIIVGPEAILEDVSFGDIRYNGQSIPNVIGGDSIATNRIQAAFLGLEARRASLNALNLSCYKPFTQLNPLEIGLKTNTGAAIASPGVLFQFITAVVG